MSRDYRSTSRRVFLKSAGVTALAGFALPGCNVLLWPDVRTVARAMTAMLHRPQLAKDTGRRYLEANGSPATASLESLTRVLLASIEQDMDRLTLVSAEGLRRSLAEKVREDFSTENTAKVGGWLLSRTECLLCAIAYLDDA